MFVGFIIFLFGLIVGSFLNVLIYRLPRFGLLQRTVLKSEKRTVLGGRSECPKCRHTLSWLDLFPVVSFLFLKGKCRYCRKKISLRYPLVELLTGASFLFLFLSNKLLDAASWISFAIWAGVIALLIVLFFIDLEHLIIPDKILIALAIIALALLIQGQPLDGGNLWHNILTGFFSALFFFLIYLATKGKAIGLGDVKFIFVLGFLFGFPGILIVIYGALAAGTLWGIVLIWFFGAKLKTKIPFGTVLSAVSIIFILLNKFLIPALSPYILHLYV